MDDGQNYSRRAINTGSVGKPKEGTPKGCYDILTIKDFSNIKIAESITVEFIRLDYNIEKAARAVEGSPYPMNMLTCFGKVY